MVNLVDFKRIHTDYMGSRLKLIKKMKRMSEIAAFEYTSFGEITGDGEYGFGRKEVLEDAKGEKHIFLKRLELDVTSKCSMKCKCCSNMMQYYDKPCDIDKNTVINDLKRVLELVEWIDEVLIIGGEPFMYKDLGYVLNEIEKFFWGVENKIGRIELVTNGTIVPNVEVLDELSRCNVMISISNYGEKSKNLLPLINELCRFKIDYYVMDIPYWVYVEQYVDAKRILADEELLIKRKEGCCTLHRVVDQGKFYLCCHIKSLDQLHAISDEAKDCYVNIYNHEAKEQIAKYLSINEPLPRACSWCNGNSKKQWNENNKIAVAEQVKSTLEYTKYGD